MIDTPALAPPPVQPEPPYAWVVVWACFGSLALIFGVSYSFAAFFASFAAEFAAQRADVALVFGLCGLIYFVLGMGGRMLADRFGAVDGYGLPALRVMALAVLVLGLGCAALMRRAPVAPAASGGAKLPLPGYTLREALHSRTFW